MRYDDYIRNKLSGFRPSGLDVQETGLPLFDFQDALSRWALRLGRSAIFADTGLGKTRMQLAWAHHVHKHTGQPVLILAPLAVAEQTVEEGASIGVRVEHHREQPDTLPGITITNYERLHKFDAELFGGVVLDESSIIKHHDSKTLVQLMDAFKSTPYKLCATATPAPNDWTELGTHAEFLGVCTRAEMLSEFFVHDGGETQVWRLKGHARDAFWRWVSSWGALVRSPADLGFDGSRYDLPALTVHQHTVMTEQEAPQGLLFAMEAQTLMERRSARRDSTEERVRACVEMIAGSIKLAASKLAEGQDHAMESRVLAESTEEDGFGPGISSETHCAGEPERPGLSKGVHAGLLPKQSREVGEADPGNASQTQRGQTFEIRDRPGSEGGGKGVSESMASSEPGEAEGAEAEAIRDRSRGLSRTISDAGWSMRDMRARRHERPEYIPTGGSLPLDGEGPWPPVPELQSGVGEIQGRHEPIVQRDSLPQQKWLVWCELNLEQDALEKAFRSAGVSVVSIQGSTPLDRRVEMEQEWRLGSVDVLISKASVFGWGMNWQHCNQMAFVGVTDSFESYYQAVRRCWRFGQTKPVSVHIFASELEGAVVANLQRKERDARAMAESLAAQTAASVAANVLGTTRSTNDYNATRAVKLPAFMRA